MAVTRARLAKALVEEVAVTHAEAAVAVDAVLQTMKAALARHERIELRGFGVCRVRPRKTGMARNIKTGEVMRIESAFTVKFRAGSTLADLR